MNMTLWGWIFFISGWCTIIALSLYCFSRVLLSKKKKDTLTGVSSTGRDQWASRVGLILAMAGNAIGLGNFLRFPVKAAQNGGGAFMIPYFISLLLLGIPLMWVEWTVGRMGGVKGHGTAPGMFDMMWKNKAAKYVGALGISIPFVIVVYYTFIESWTIGYAWFSATGKYFGNANREAMEKFLLGYQGVEHNQFFPTVLPILIFLGISLLLNYLFLYRGISKGIELLAKVGMPVLFVFGIILAIRVLTIGTPDPTIPDQNVMKGLAFIWNPDFSRLTESGVWLAAAGQIFFTLSLGQGIINSYASYLKENDDVTLNGITTSSTNEFAEVILGGTIAIPLAVAFFGVAATQELAKQGSFNLGFVSLPLIFQKLPLGQLFGSMWFFLLFIAGITSSVAMTTPAIAFLEDEFKWSRKKAVNIVFAVVSVATTLVFVFFRFGFLDELDYWGGTFSLVVFATIEIIIFSWIFGMKKGWAEMHKGADLKVPVIFKFIIQWVTPFYMLIMLGFWTYQEAVPKLLMHNEEASRHPYLWAARGLYLLLILISIWMVRVAWKNKEKSELH